MVDVHHVITVRVSEQRTADARLSVRRENPRIINVHQTVLIEVSLKEAARDFWIREITKQITLAPDQITIELNSKRIDACKNTDWLDLKADNTKTHNTTSTCLYKPTIEQRRGNTILKLNIQIKRLDGKRLLLSPDGQDLFIPAEPKPQDHIVTAIGNAYHWRKLITENNLTLPQLAKQVGYSESQIRKYLPLINLSPNILKHALTGHLPSTITLLNLLAAARNLDWQQQAQYLGIEQTTIS